MENLYVPKRYIVTFLAFFGLFNAYCMRVNVSVAIVAMVNNSQSAFLNGSHLTSECPGPTLKEDLAQNSIKGEHYNWDSSTQGYILSAFFYGYIITMFPGGYLAEKFGAVRLFGLCIFSTAVLTLLTPITVKWGLIPFLILRFLEGLGEGASYPCVLAIISRWSPILERSRIASFILSGAPLGSVVSLMLSGVFSSSEAMGGWPSVFYFFGALGCLWFLLWVIFIYETPDVHPTISEDEILKYKDNTYVSNKNVEMPWKAIATSIPFWAVAVTNVGQMFGFNVMITEIPTYLHTVLHFGIKLSGYLTSLPQICETLGSWLASFIADKCRAAQKCHITTIRKIFNSIGGFGPVVCLLIVAFSGCHSTLIVILLSFGCFLNGAKYSGYYVAVVDMSPNFAGVLYGISNGLGNITGILGPTMIGAITSTGATLANWKKVFCITAGIYFFTTIVFAIFASSELQPWGKGKPSNSDKEEKS